MPTHTRTGRLLRVSDTIWDVCHAACVTCGDNHQFTVFEERWSNTGGALAACDSLVFKEADFSWHLYSLKLFKMLHYIQDFASEQQ